MAFKTTWDIDQEAIDKWVPEILGLKHPLKVWSRPNCVHQLGRYAGFTAKGHRVTIATNLVKGPIDASRILWHEATHAAQVERYKTEDDYLDAYYEQLESIGLSTSSITAGKPVDVRYREIPFEKEAFAIEQIFGARYPLAKRIRRRK